MSEFDESGDIAKVKITVKREEVSNGPLFGKYTTYTATIVVWDMNGNWREFTKEYGRTTFSKLQQDLEKSKQEWFAKGLSFDKVEIDYTNSNSIQVKE